MARRSMFTALLAAVLILSTPGQPPATGFVPPASATHHKSFLQNTDGTPPAFVGDRRGT